MQEIIGHVEAESQISVPIWSVNHFLDNTTSNYLKLVTLREICRRYREGAEDSNFLISMNSYDLFPAVDDLYYKQNDLIVLESKDQSAENFWHLFQYLHRPVVLFRDQSRLTPIYEIESNVSLKIVHLSLVSPVSFDLKGAMGVLIDLFSLKIFVQRANERNAEALTNLKNVVETSHLIEDQCTPPGVRRFAINQLASIMDKQTRINRRLGIRNPRLRI
jgi:hypothetical protein